MFRIYHIREPFTIRSRGYAERTRDAVPPGPRFNEGRLRFFTRRFNPNRVAALPPTARLGRGGVP
jgi:hypothetical protein